MRIQNINNHQHYQKNQSHFGSAKLILEEKNLLWNTAEKYGYKEKYVDPLKALFKKITQQPEFKNALEKAPENTIINVGVTNFSPGAFFVDVKVAEDLKHSSIIAPTGMNESQEDLFVKSLIKSIN